MLVLRMVEERFHRDVEGRPIRESRTPPELLRPDDIERKTCPYAGSRYQHAKPMNVSALRQISAHWDEVNGTLAFVRAAYTAARGGYAGDVLDVWRVSQLGSALPWFYLLQDRPVPAHAAALSKATLGTGIWAQAVIAKLLSERWMPPVLTAASVLELAERSGTLIGETEVCSAGDKMLLRFFDVLVGAPTEADGGELAASRDALLGLGAHYLGLKQLLWLYFLARRFLYADVAAALGDTPPALLALRAATCEPQDFFVVEPDDPAGLPGVTRGAWFELLAGFVVPFAPGRTDAALRTAADRLASMMREPPAGPAFDALVLEVGAPLARPLATYLQLDTLFGAIVMHVELAFRAALGSGTGPVAADAGNRDRVLASSPRAYFTSLAPRTFAAHSTP